MNNDGMKLVEFEKWCPKCKDFKTEEFEEPCNSCLHEAGNAYSHKPVNFKESSQKKQSV